MGREARFIIFARSEMEIDGWSAVAGFDRHCTEVQECDANAVDRNATANNLKLKTIN